MLVFLLISSVFGQPPNWQNFHHPPPWNQFGPPRPGPPHNGRGFEGIPPPMEMRRPSGPVTIILPFESNHDILGDLRNHRHDKMDPQQWKRKFHQLCRRFPGHPECRKGMIPDFADVDRVLNGFGGPIGKYLKRVPKIPHHDWFQGIHPGLRQHLNDIPHQLGEISLDHVQTLRGMCRGDQCRKQPDHAQKLKQLVSTKIVEFEQKKTGRDTSESVHLRIDRTQQLKQALLERGNLTEQIEPLDNGVFDLDTLLTEEQADILLNSLGKAGVGADEAVLPPLEGDSVKQQKARVSKRASVFFEKNIVKKWESTGPIQFIMDESLEDSDKKDVRSAIYEIERNTCIRFKELQKAPTGSHIVYYKVDSPSFCGLSYVGRTEPANPVYLSFGCSNNKGVAIHETMHALGVAHQHLRVDRDQHITVNWSNINPQQYDAFVVVDASLYTSYGVKYAYDSIMHYNAYTAARDFSVATMVPKVDKENNLSVLGQRDRMATTDIELLKKMYCQPACEDKNIYCGAWALKSLCTDKDHDVWMASNCRKSCNLCGT